MKSLEVVVLLCVGCLADASAGATVDAEVPEDTGEPIPGTCILDPASTSDRFADCVEGFEPGSGASHGHDQMPDIVLGPPRGEGDATGSLDVAALGCGGTITLAFDGPGIADGPGVDFLVFENPFRVGVETFSEPAWVGVSDDGTTWSWFPCVLDGMGTWPASGCAGLEPVYSAPDNGVDPTDPEAAGGDAFDLAELGLTRARFVRLLDATVEFYGHETWCGGVAGGFDLDGMAIVNEAP